MLLQLVDLAPLAPILLVDVDVVVVGAKGDLCRQKAMVSGGRDRKGMCKLQKRKKKRKRKRKEVRRGRARSEKGGSRSGKRKMLRSV